MAHQTVRNIAQAKTVLHEANRTYNEGMPHLSCDMRKPDEAHQLATRLPQRWKNYYRGVNLSQDENTLVNPRQELQH